jgi:hypothetical protein
MAMWNCAISMGSLRWRADAGRRDRRGARECPAHPERRSAIPVSRPTGTASHPFGKSRATHSNWARRLPPWCGSGILLGWWRRVTVPWGSAAFHGIPGRVEPKWNHGSRRRLGLWLEVIELLGTPDRARTYNLRLRSNRCSQTAEPTRDPRFARTWSWFREYTTGGEWLIGDGGAKSSGPPLLSPAVLSTDTKCGVSRESGAYSWRPAGPSQRTPSGS